LKKTLLVSSEQAREVISQLAKCRRCRFDFAGFADFVREVINDSKGEDSLPQRQDFFGMS